MPHQRLERLRERLQRRKTARRAKKRATARKRERRRERVEANEPETTRGEALATARQTKLLAAELGVSRGRAAAIQAATSDRLETAIDKGGAALERLDTDGDGDTDLLSATEASIDLQTDPVRDEFSQAQPSPTSDGTIDLEPDIETEILDL